MRVAKFLLSCALVLALAACHTVTSVSPVGDVSLYLEPDKWEGMWIHQPDQGLDKETEPEIVMVRVLDAAAGILEYGDPNDCSKRTQVVLRAHSSNSTGAFFVNQLDAWGYRWGKFWRVGDALVIWPPEQKAFLDLISKGKLAGQLFREGGEDSDLVIERLSQTQLDLITSDKSLFDYEFTNLADLVWFRTSELIPGLSGACPSQAGAQSKGPADNTFATLAATPRVIKSIDDVGQVDATINSSPDWLRGNVAVNNAGQVLVDLYTLARGFVWHDGVTISLPETITNVGGMNNSGQIVGRMAPDRNTVPHAMLWDASHGVLDLGTLGGDWSEATAVNDRGQVVGSSPVRQRSDDIHAFIWEDHVMTDIGAPEGATSHAEAINQSGQVVGFVDMPSQWDFDQHQAFLWTRSTGMTMLGSLGGMSSLAYAINDSGDVVGVAQTVQGYWRPFLWQTGKGMVDLCTLGGRDAVATAINNAGQVVGWSEIKWGDEEERHAFLWDKGKMIDLSVLPEIKAAGWSALTSAMGINDHGQIVGKGLRDGKPHVFLLTLDPTSSQVR